jgi:hypothetical protein
MSAILPAPVPAVPLYNIMDVIIPFKRGMKIG